MKNIFTRIPLTLELVTVESHITRKTGFLISLIVPVLYPQRDNGYIQKHLSFLL